MQEGGAGHPPFFCLLTPPRPHRGRAATMRRVSGESAHWALARTPRARPDHLGNIVMTLSVIGNLAILVMLLLFLYRLQQTHVSFTRRVFSGLGLGILFGAACSCSTAPAPTCWYRPATTWTSSAAAT